MSSISVSIIIPTYNRAHLIAETLDSIIAQNFHDWECIIVDDGSTDNTYEFVNAYVQKDSRFKYFHRTDKYLPGGNGARNYGLDLAQGEYIVFFDSDDLMTINHLQVKYDLINSGDYNFAVTRTKYFNYSNKHIDKYYNYSTNDITKENYILQKINWLTLDVIIKSTIAKNIRFNEKLKSGQEYNYFSKLVCKTEKGVFLNKIVSLRRYHENSKSGSLVEIHKKYESMAISTWNTFNDVFFDIKSPTKKKIIFRIYKNILISKNKPKDIDYLDFWKALFKFHKKSFISKITYYYVNKYTNRFNFLRKRALAN